MIGNLLDTRVLYIACAYGWKITGIIMLFVSKGQRGVSIMSAGEKYLGQESEESIGTIENPIEIPDTPEKTPQIVSTANPMASNQENSCSNFKLLSWNLDGLHKKDLKERTISVIGLIRERQPDVVYLQEVVDATCEAFQMLRDEYIVLQAEGTDSYFNVMLLRQATVKPTKQLTWNHFNTSQMGRHLLIQPALFCNKVKLILMTSHLESTKECGNERKKQLQALYSNIVSQDSEYFVIFGGDTNLRDKEVQDVGLPWHVDDMWEACGRNVETKYTWDTTVNDNLGIDFNSKLRFDRVYYRKDASIALQPVCFMLVGQERLASGCFPSDHWGMWCEFKQS